MCLIQVLANTEETLATNIADVATNDEQCIP